MLTYHKIFSFDLPAGYWKLENSIIDWNSGTHHFIFVKTDDTSHYSGEFQPEISDYRVWRSTDGPVRKLEMTAYCITGGTITRHGPVTVNQDTGGGDDKDVTDANASTVWNPYCFNLGSGRFNYDRHVPDYKNNEHKFYYSSSPSGSVGTSHCPLVTAYGPGNRGFMYGQAYVDGKKRDRQGPVQVNQDTGGGNPS